MAGEYLQATPYANPLTGLSNDAIQGLLSYMKDAQRTQQMQMLAGLLESTGIPKTVERAAYAESPKALLDALTNVNRANVPLLKPETAEAIMNVAPLVGPAAKAAERGAMAAGRAGERYAEKVVPQIMERGGLPAQLLGDLSQGSIRPIDVWHGSPHGPFGSFDPKKIGTGEGAQVYSVGHYLGEARGTGEEYRRNLSASKFLKENQFNEDGTPNRVVQAAFQMDSGVPTDEIRDAMSDVLVNASKQDVDKIIKDAQKLFRKTENSGYLYKVDLPDEQIAKMVEWETPLSEMDSKLASVIEPLQKQLMSGPNPSLFKNARSVGDVIQYANATGLNPHESLKASGYPGIKYLDEQSRAAGKGTRNFVVFPGNEDLLKIKEINDKPYEQWFPKTNLLETAEPKAAQSLLDTSYRGSHTAPNPEFGAPLYDLTGGGQMYPADVYSSKAVQYYGTGYPKADKEAFALANKVRGNPDAEVTMYRAVPKDAGIEAINKGDWVTLSKDYAKNHGESVLDNNYKIISQKVKAKDLWTNADSIQEFGYWPE